MSHCQKASVMRLNGFWFSHSDNSEVIGWLVWLLEAGRCNGVRLLFTRTSIGKTFRQAGAFVRGWADLMAMFGCGQRLVSPFSLSPVSSKPASWGRFKTGHFDLGETNIWIRCAIKEISFLRLAL
jgi:hypothetical protein